MGGPRPKRPPPPTPAPAGPHFLQFTHFWYGLWHIAQTNSPHLLCVKSVFCITTLTLTLTVCAGASTCCQSRWLSSWVLIVTKQLKEVTLPSVITMCCDCQPRFIKASNTLPSRQHAHTDARAQRHPGFSPDQLAALFAFSQFLQSLASWCTPLLPVSQFLSPISLARLLCAGPPTYRDLRRRTWAGGVPKPVVTFWSNPFLIFNCRRLPQRPRLKHQWVYSKLYRSKFNRCIHCKVKSFLFEHLLVFSPHLFTYF